MTATGFELPGFGGRLIHPGDAEYDEARTVFNAMVDRRPALIARCASAEDVVAAVSFARKEGLALSVYGGGHGVTGAAVIDAGICIDLRGMRDVKVDAGKRTARVAGGCTWGEVDAATQAHGLAVTGGRVTTTGVAGLTLGSGSGWLERKFGLVCDNLQSVELVTADGRKITASETENRELFWGIRGGSGNFGIVTAFNLQLHPLGPMVYGGMLVFPGFMGEQVLRTYRDFVENAPDEIGSGLAFITAPPEDFVPEEARGMPAIGIVCCYAGPAADGPAAYAPLVELGPAVNLLDEIPYVAVQQLLDPPNQKGLQNYWSADFYSELPNEAVDVLVAHATKPVSPFTQIIVIPGGGAIARVDEDATAFGPRNAPWNIHYLSMWADPADTEANIAYTRTLANAMKPWSTGRVYLNFIGDEGLDRVEAAFGPDKYARLRKLKREWDPDNVFRHNQNIPPAE